MHLADLVKSCPRYTYIEPKDTPQGALLSIEPERRDNITDEALDAYHARYGEWVTKDQIFSYVYGNPAFARLSRALRGRSRQAAASHPRSRDSRSI